MIPPPPFTLDDVHHRDCKAATTSTPLSEVVEEWRYINIVPKDGGWGWEVVGGQRVRMAGGGAAEEKKEEGGGGSGRTKLGWDKGDGAKRTSFLLSLANRAFARVPSGKLPSVTYRDLELETLLDYAAESLRSQAALIDLSPPVTVVGDIHGFYRDLLNILCTIGSPPENRYLFLGDYVDRGEQSIEAITLLLVYKTLYPNSVFLLRGNHEVARINFSYGFYKECVSAYPTGGAGERLYKQFNHVFDLLPIAALIGGKILCMHGGLSPYLQSLEQLRAIPKPIVNPVSGLVNDILWSDPEVEISGWQPSPRRTSFIFGADVVKRFCSLLGVDLIVRAHQCCQDGVRFFADRRLLTLFSAPMYCPIVKNSAAVMKVQPDFVCSFVFFTPPPRRVPTHKFN